MAKINNFHEPHQIIFEINLINNGQFIYDKKQADYLNWIPCRVKLTAEEKVYTFQDIITLSLEGLKNFLMIFQELQNENNSIPKKLENSEKYKTYEYYATEGEFIIEFKNIADNYDGDLVMVVLWMHMGACSPTSQAYFQGFRFWVSFRELEIFFMEINEQLCGLMDNC